MRPERKLVAARALAQHCAELVRAAPGPEVLIPLFERAGERLARTFAPALAPLIGGKGPQVKAAPARRTTLAELAQGRSALAAHALLGIGAGQFPLLLSLDGAAVLRMVDRTFGGRGEAPSPLPGVFPVSAELLTGRLEALLVAQIDAALCPENPGASRTLRRHVGLSELEPFAPDEQLVALEFEVTEPAGERWHITIALPLAALGALFGAAPRPVPALRKAADPFTAPFADLPLELSAVLVDMRMSMAVLAGIEPGTVLPVSVARAVPLRLGGLAIATGTVGAADDRVALQITTAF